MTDALPPVPDTGHIDLSSMPYMPLMIDEFLNSKLVNTVGSPYSINNMALCCSAFRAVPAGSVPDDDDQLMIESGFRGSKTDFIANRAIILRGFVKHADGRLYHPFVIRKAQDVWDSNEKNRQRFQNQTSAANEARRRNAQRRRDEAAMQGTGADCDNDVRLDPPDVTYDVGDRPTGNGFTCTADPVAIQENTGREPISELPPAVPQTQQNQGLAGEYREPGNDVCNNQRHNDLNINYNLKKEESPLPPKGAGTGSGDDLFVPASETTAPKTRQTKPPKGMTEEDLEGLWQAFRYVYPMRKGNMGWQDARKNFVECLKQGAKPDDLLKAAKNYDSNMVEDGKVSAKDAKELIRTEFVMMPSRFLNPRTKLWEEATADFEQRKLIKASGGTVTRLDGRRGDGRPQGRPAPAEIPRSYRGPWA